METAYIVECRIVVDGNLKSSVTLPMAYKKMETAIKDIKHYITRDKADGFKIENNNEPFVLTKRLTDMEIKYIYSYRMVYIYE